MFLFLEYVFRFRFGFANPRSVFLHPSPFSAPNLKILYFGFSFEKINFFFKTFKFSSCLENTFGFSNIQTVALDTLGAIGHLSILIRTDSL